VSEIDLYNEAKKKLAKRFYINTSIGLVFTLGIFIAGVIALALHWENYDSQTINWLLLFTIAFLFLSFFLIGLIFNGHSKIKRNDLQVITGTVVGFKASGNADGAIMYVPIVQIRNGKTVTVGVNKDKDGVELGHKYKFLSLMGTLGATVVLEKLPVDKPKEKSSN